MIFLGGLWLLRAVTATAQAEPQPWNIVVFMLIADAAIKYWEYNLHSSGRRKY